MATGAHGGPVGKPSERTPIAREGRSNTHMKANINILDIGNDVTDTWTRRFRFTYNGRAVVEADLCWTGEPYGYELYIEDIECYDEDPSANREVETAVHAWAEGLGQHDLFELDMQTMDARKVLS